MISVDDALARIFDLTAPLQSEAVALADAAGRVLTHPVAATRNQPPFTSSAMDGYAVIKEEVQPGATFSVIGESAAGHRFSGDVKPGQAVRIFTGAPVPDGANRVVIQENVIRTGDQIRLSEYP